MKTINIKTIRIDGGTQSRVEINNEIVTEYAEAIKAGAEFPAVVVFNDGADYWLADGFHRFHAHGQAGKTSIAADVRQGTVRDAKLYSFGANGKHGQRPSQADRRKAIDAMLADAEWALWSNNAIAKACDVSPHTVAARRESLCNLHSENATERTYTTKHGTTAVMKTDAIGKVEILRRDPKFYDANVKKPAQAVDVSGEDAGFDDGTDLEKYEAEVKETVRLNDLVESLTATDTAAEIKKLKGIIDGLTGRLNASMAAQKAMERAQQHSSDFVHKLRKMIGVDSHQEILDAVAAMRAEA